MIIVLFRDWSSARLSSLALHLDLVLGNSLLLISFQLGHGGFIRTKGESFVRTNPDARAAGKGNTLIILAGYGVRPIPLTFFYGRAVIYVSLRAEIVIFVESRFC